MKYEHMIRAEFVDRPNRFIANVSVDGHIEKAHVKNTGRCRELLIPGTDVFLQVHDDPKRKTKYSLITVKKENKLVNMDSQVPNALAAEFIENGGLLPIPVEIRREKTFGDSRFDIFAKSGSREMFIEVKGVTLEEDGIARFPDAPTQRGIKHVKGLMEAVKEGYEAALIFIIQMKGIHHFEPNIKAQPEFAEVLKAAEAAGVHIMALDCRVTEDTISVDEEIPVVLL